jgi:hypothetical protein
MNLPVLSIDEYNGMGSYHSHTEYDYVEIGTCDWDVLSMTKPSLKGIIVEPIKMYINNIPHNPNVAKVNCAISTENKMGNMFYIPPDVIEENNIVNCFRGMNKLNEPHMGAVSNNLLPFCKQEECEVITYFELLRRHNITYVDFLKTDTEGHDCAIINNILDNLHLFPEYILPRYIFFENNGLTPLQTRIDTIDRLYRLGYVHIYTEDDNTFLYNCTTFYLRTLMMNNIKLARDAVLNDKDSLYFFQDVHSYMTYGQIDLFKNILKLPVTTCSDDASHIWTTQDINDHNKYANPTKKLVNIFHGGGYIHSKLLELATLNIMVKSISDYKYLLNTNHNTSLFIGKYKCQEKIIIQTFDHRQQHYANLSKRFLMLNGFFKCNPTAVQNTYHALKDTYNLDLYGFDSELGWANIFDNSDITNNILSKYKFMLHLKGNGYLCNSVICACMVGMPVIMSKDVYINTLYYQYIPEELVILIDNNNIGAITPNEIIPVLENALKMSDSDYQALSKKIYVHSTFFREYYNFELEHLYHFMNHL